MTRWMIRIHMYTGLLNFTALVLFGVVGIVATALPPHAERAQPEPGVELVEFEIPGGMDDRQLADHIQATLRIPLTGRPPDWTLKRDDDNNLRFRLPTPARGHEIVVLEAESRLRIETLLFPTWQYLIHLHEMVPSRVTPDLRIQAWAWYIEFSIWSLILMALSGLYLWLESRPGYRWAQVSFGVGSLIFVCFYWFVR